MKKSSVKKLLIIGILVIPIIFVSSLIQKKQVEKYKIKSIYELNDLVYENIYNHLSDSYDIVSDSLIINYYNNDYFNYQKE